MMLSNMGKLSNEEKGIIFDVILFMTQIPHITVQIESYYSIMIMYNNTHTHINIGYNSFEKIYSSLSNIIKDQHNENLINHKIFFHEDIKERGLSFKESMLEARQYSSSTTLSKEEYSQYLLKIQSIIDYKATSEE